MAGFHTTRWSLILAARDDSADARGALDQLCRTYRPAVVSYLRSRGRSRERADDLAQGFFARFLEYRYHEIADPARGRFRVFLGSALNNYLITEAARARRAKRGGGAEHAELDEQLVADDASPSPEQAFDRAWAMTVIEHAVAALKAEAEANGKGALFERLREFLAEAPDAEDYAQAAADLGMRQNTVAVSVHRLRDRLREKVREQLADTVANPEDVDDELRALRAVLGGVAR